MRRLVYISRNYKHPNCGGGRARMDIESIMQSMGFENIGIRCTTSRNGIVHSLRNAYGILRAIRRLKKGDVVVVQYQMKMYERLCRAAKKCGAKVICLIHDLDSWREKILTPEQEIPLLNMADVLLTHNHAMRKWLSDHGCTAPMVDYDIMDYLPGESSPPHPYPADGNFSLFFVGNLSSKINDWIYQLAELLPHRDIFLYGPNFDAEKAGSLPNLKHLGVKNDTDIIASHQGDFGISWYGLSLDDGIGMIGEYMAINNPHKIGLYLRCNAPIVVWSKAGRAKLMLKKNIAVAVDSLRDLDATLNAISADNYNHLINNAVQMNNKLKRGHYLRKAVLRALETITINE